VKPPAFAPARPAAAPAAPVAREGKFTSEDVNLGHLMELRLHVGFKATAFGDAKRALADERYATIDDAARAVAETAIEISNDSSGRDPFERH
jgi:hypothetical protein